MYNVRCFSEAVSVTPLHMGISDNGLFSIPGQPDTDTAESHLDRQYSD